MSKSLVRREPEDWINLLQQIYALDGDAVSWMTGLLNAVPGGIVVDGTAAFTFRIHPTSVNVDEVAAIGDPSLTDRIQELAEISSTESMNLIFRSGKVVATLSEYVWPRDPSHATVFQEVVQRPPDVLGVVAHSGVGDGIVLNFLLSARRRSTAAERRRWMRGAAHIGAAIRLRRLGRKLTQFDENAIEAVLDASGKIHDACGEAAHTDARQAIRSAVARIDTARRNKNRADPDRVLENWDALVHGRWSLIDKFDTDQRRFVLAVRNDPRFRDPRGLSQQERQIAEYIALGRSTKEIAYILGVPAASAENCARRAQAKLGLKSRVELATFFSTQGVRARLAEVALDGETLLIGSSPTLSGEKIAALTAAERSVVTLIIAGSSNDDIAQRRSTTARTVANQVQAIFRKLGARSRCELISILAGQSLNTVGF